MISLLKTELIDRLDPDFTYLKQAIRTALAALIAIVLYHYKSHWAQGYWIILAAAFIMQTRLGHTQLQQLKSVAICGICAAILAYFAGFFWHSTLWLALYLAVTTFFTLYIGILGVDIAMGAFFVNLFAIMSAGLVVDSMGQQQRFFMVLLGAGLAFLMCFLWPTKIRNNWNHSLKIYFLCLAEFCRTLGHSYQTISPAKKVKLETTFHERRSRALRLLNKVRSNYLLLQHKKDEAVLLERAEHLFLAIIAVGNLRHRLDTMTDLKDLIICIHHEIAIALQAIAAGNKVENLQEIKNNLHKLEMESALLQIESEQGALLAFIYNVHNIINYLS